MTIQDLKKVRRDFIHKIFPSLVVTLVIFLMVFLYACFARDFGWIFLLLTSLSVVSGMIAFILFTAKHRKDLREKKVLLEEKMVDGRVEKVHHEPGSATVPVNLFSIFFIRQILMRTMKEEHVYYIVAGGEKVVLEKSEFDLTAEGQPTIIRKALYTGIFLGIMQK